MDYLLNNRLSNTLGTPKHPLADALLLLYVSVLGNYVGQTISSNLQQYIERDSMTAEYAILALMLFVTIVLQLQITTLPNMIATTGMVMLLFYVGSLYGKNFNMFILTLLAMRYTSAKFIDHYENMPNNEKFVASLKVFEKACNTGALGTLILGGGYKLLQKVKSMA